MIFSLDTIKDSSELNLTHASSLPILSVGLEPTKLKLGDEFNYYFCDQISQLCRTVHFMPETKTIVLDYNGFCNLVFKSDIIFSNFSVNLGVTKASATEQAQKFFQNKNVIVQAGGVQEAVYQLGSSFQSVGSAGAVANTLGLAKLAGVSGL